MVARVAQSTDAAPSIAAMLFSLGHGLPAAPWSGGRAGRFSASLKANNSDSCDDA
jgi:hypothetical protein